MYLILTTDNAIDQEYARELDDKKIPGLIVGRQ